ncbi:CPBP family intramembrane glutamic endopeptidase [Maritalea sp.]|uniref:CPBP family intramembrane glutamic endopeptidase n=1 Tax=Maritalea sp. TaxID=2003361 RepID=UPI003EF21AEA
MQAMLEMASITLLGLSILFVWMPTKQAWLVPYACFLICAIASGWVQPIGLLSLCVFGLIIRLSALGLQKWKAYAVNTLVVITALVAASHLAPGFTTLSLFENAQLSENTSWTALRFTADKPSFGLFLLVAKRDFLCSSLREFGRALNATIVVILAGCACIYLLSLMIHFMTFDISLSWLVAIWFIRNLVFTVVAEEVFFRGFVQPTIEGSLRTRHKAIIALLMTSLLFGVVHLYGGWQYGLLATAAGILYGYAFMNSRKLEMAMLAHVALNTGHMFFFSYP